MVYRAEIDGLRAVAVLAVLVFHAGFGLSGGFAGVDVFFVISGFLITSIVYRDIEDGRFTYLDFYERRVRRLAPAFVTVLAATSLWAGLFMFAPDLEDFGASAAASVVFLANFYFYGEVGYFTEAAEAKPLLHLWSLGVEEQFYLIAPLLLRLMAVHAPRRLHIPLIAGFAALSFAFCVWQTARDPAAAFYLPYARAWQMAAGALLAVVLAQNRSPQQARTAGGPSFVGEAMALGGLALIAGSYLLLDDDAAYPGWRALAPTLGAALVIAGAGQSRSMAQRWLSAQPAVFVGKISYPLYLWHWPVFVAIGYGGHGPLSPTEGVVGIAVSFVLAVLTWRYIETPFRERRALGAGPRLFAGAGLAAASLAGVALFFSHSSGMPNRHDPQLMAYLDHAQYFNDTREKCHFITPVRAAQGDVCVLGRSGAEPSFVLAGDSHADALSPAVFAAADNLGLSGWQFTGPGFMPAPDRRPRHAAFTDPRIEALIRFLHERPEAETVVVAGFWLFAAHGETYRATDLRFADVAPGGENVRGNEAVLERALLRLTAEFPERRFVFLDDAPSGWALHLRSYARAMAVKGEAPAGLPRSEEAAQRALYEPVLQRVADAAPNAHYRRVHEALCSADLCPLFGEDGEPIYRDGDHLSATGALRLTGALEAVLIEKVVQPELMARLRLR